MTSHAYYANAIRESHQAWDRAVEAATLNVTQSLRQVHETATASATSQPLDYVVDYVTRTLDSQSDVSRKMAALSAELSEQMLSHGEGVATAARDYLGTAQQVLRDQAGRQYSEF